MNYKLFLYNLLFLILPVVAFYAWFSYDTLSDSSGGSYDLGDLYKPLIIIAFLILFIIIFLVRVFSLQKKTNEISIESKITFFTALGMLLYFSVSFLSKLN